MFLDTLSLPLFDLFDAELNLRFAMFLYVLLTEGRLKSHVRPYTREYANMTGDWVLPIRIKAPGHPAEARRENSMVLVHVSGIQEAASPHEPLVRRCGNAEASNI